MSLLSVKNLKKSFGEKLLFSGLTFVVEDRARIAIIGANGSGKSSLLKILAGLEPANEGIVSGRQGIRIEYLPQNPKFAEEQTVLEYVFASNKGEAALVREYEAVCRALEMRHDDPSLQKQFGELSHRMDSAAAWEYETRAKTVLTRLHILDFDAPVSSLSGGYRKRLALAHALLAESDVLMLDEPTNHLDADTIEWLEEYLRRFSGAVLLVTHDRYFLERVALRIIEIDRSTARAFEGSYSFYLEHKAEQEAEAASQEERRKNILRKEMAWLQRGCRARSTKSKERVRRVRAMAEDKGEAGRASIAFTIQTRRLGGKIVEISNVSKAFDGRPILKNYSHTFSHGERLGIIGPNGSGKTTLANLITGRVTPDKGAISVGETVCFAYYDQESHGLDPRERAIDYVKREGGEMLQGVDGSIQTAETVMKQFLFTSQTLYTPVENLSGGERRRLYLVGILMSNPNFLVLDEPTNDLDIQTLQALEDFLDGFGGCLVVISHDRYFLDRTVNSLIALQPDGTVRGYPGSYATYVRMLEEEQAENAVTLPPSDKRDPPVSGKRDSVADTAEASAPSRKLSYKEQRELAGLEADIPRLESQLGTLRREMANAATDYKRLHELAEEQKRTEALLESSMERWLEISTQMEQKGSMPDR